MINRQHVELILSNKIMTSILKLFIFCALLCYSNAIDCFKCVSVNRDYLPCEDPFHHNYTSDIFESPCLGGRKDRDGLFPATSCVKINGVFDDNGDTIIIRACALDSGTLTTDTELVRMSHCGRFYYENRYARGCVQSCNDADACNLAPKLMNASVFIPIISCSSILYTVLSSYYTLFFL